MDSPSSLSPTGRPVRQCRTPGLDPAKIVALKDIEDIKGKKVRLPLPSCAPPSPPPPADDPDSDSPCPPAATPPPAPAPKTTPDPRAKVDFEALNELVEKHGAIDNEADRGVKSARWKLVAADYNAQFPQISRTKKQLQHFFYRKRPVKEQSQAQIDLEALNNLVEKHGIDDLTDKSMKAKLWDLVTADYNTVFPPKSKYNLQHFFYVNRARENHRMKAERATTSQQGQGRFVKTERGDLGNDLFSDQKKILDKPIVTLKVTKKEVDPSDLHGLKVTKKEVDPGDLSSMQPKVKVIKMEAGLADLQSGPPSVVVGSRQSLNRTAKKTEADLCDLQGDPLATSSANVSKIGRQVAKRAKVNKKKGANLSSSLPLKIASYGSLGQQLPQPKLNIDSQHVAQQIQAQTAILAQLNRSTLQNLMAKYQVNGAVSIGERNRRWKLVELDYKLKHPHHAGITAKQLKYFYFRIGQAKKKLAEATKATNGKVRGRPKSAMKNKTVDTGDDCQIVEHKTSSTPAAKTSSTPAAKTSSTPAARTSSTQNTSSVDSKTLAEIALATKGPATIGELTISKTPKRKATAEEPSLEIIKRKPQQQQQKNSSFSGKPLQVLQQPEQQLQQSVKFNVKPSVNTNTGPDLKPPASANDYKAWQEYYLAKAAQEEFLLKKMQRRSMEMDQQRL